MTSTVLPEDFSVYVGEDGTVVNHPSAGYDKRPLPTINEYLGPDGGYILCYSRNKEGSVYSLSEDVHVMGQIRLPGKYNGRIFHPYAYENQDISAVQELKDLCNRTFPACKGSGWAGGDSGGWFGFK